MKPFFLFLILFISKMISYSQPLEGEWRGTFNTGKPFNTYSSISKREINLYFTKINDTTFEGQSITIYTFDDGIKDTCICVVKGRFVEKYILYLEETMILKNYKDDDATDCLSTMQLYYHKRKKYLELEGGWYTKNDQCGHGGMTVTKKL